MHASYSTSSQRLQSLFHHHVVYNNVGETERRLGTNEFQLVVVMLRSMVLLQVPKSFSQFISFIIVEYLPCLLLGLWNYIKFTQSQSFWCRSNTVSLPISIPPPSHHLTSLSQATMHLGTQYIMLPGVIPTLMGLQNIISRSGDRQLYFTAHHQRLQYAIHRKNGNY